MRCQKYVLQILVVFLALVLVWVAAAGENAVNGDLTRAELEGIIGSQAVTCKHHIGMGRIRVCTEMEAPCARPGCPTCRTKCLPRTATLVPFEGVLQSVGYNVTMKCGEGGLGLKYSVIECASRCRCIYSEDVLGTIYCNSLDTDYHKSCGEG